MEEDIYVVIYAWSLICTENKFCLGLFENNNNKQQRPSFLLYSQRSLATVCSIVFLKEEMEYHVVFSPSIL